MSASEAIPLSGAQCRAARALTDVSRAMLADMSGISETVIDGFDASLSNQTIRFGPSYVTLSRRSGHSSSMMTSTAGVAFV
jgi:hypothetical protein